METGNLIYLDIDDIPKVVGLRLDELISWRWELVFVPVWVLFALAMIGVSYSVLLAVIFFLSTNISNEQRHYYMLIRQALQHGDKHNEK